MLEALLCPSIIFHTQPKLETANLLLHIATTSTAVEPIRPEAYGWNRED